MALSLNTTNSGERRAVKSAPQPSDAESAIRTANEELQRRVGNAFDLPLTVLVEQRNRALRDAERVREEAQRQRRAATEEQDGFIAFLMADYERQLAELRREMARTEEGLARRRSLELVSSDAPELEKQLTSLQERLQEAYAEVDDTRADAVRLQEERDEAIRETNDVRFECQKQVEAARDEAVQLEWQLDEAHRRAEDAGDEARDDAYALSEQIDEVRRELDQRNAEVSALRAQLSSLDQEAPTWRPSETALELRNARNEAQLLRKGLIEAKRESSRLKNELENLRARTGFTAASKDADADFRPSEIQRRAEPR